MNPQRLTRQLAALTAAIAVTALGSQLLASPASAAVAAPAPVTTSLAANGWSTAVENPGFGSAVVVAADSPYGDNAARLDTGAGDPAGNHGGKPYLNQSGFGNTKVDAINSLGYSTKVLADAGTPLAPALNLSVVSDDPLSPNAPKWQGTLVYEPVNQTQALVENEWQTWNPLASDAKWWFSKDIVDSDGHVVLARQHTATWDEIRADFAGNPKYTNLRLDESAGGLNLSLGQAGYSAGTSNLSALADGITFGAGTDATTYDLEDGVGRIGPCDANIDSAAKTYTLTQDCDTYATINVPDGWTLNGNGHTMHAIEDSAHPNFPGPVVKAAVGTDSAATLNVENLTIQGLGFSNGANSGGLLSGIYMQRAGGKITNVTVTGISHANGVQEGVGIWARNKDLATGSTDVPRASITLSHVTVDAYQKAGIVLDGNVGITADHLTVGSSNAGDTIAANAVQISRGAHGSLTDSTIGENNYSGDDAATSVLLYDAGAVRLTRNIISGADGDVAVDVSNDSNTIDTIASVSCTLIARTSAVVDGQAVVNEDSNAPGSVDLTLGAMTYQGWATKVSGDYTAVSDPSCRPAAPKVSTTAGFGTADVSWTATAPAYAPITGYTVRIVGNKTITQQVSAGVRSAHFTGLTSGVDYTATVTAHNASGDAVGTAAIRGTTTTLTPASASISYGRAVALTGTVRTTTGAVNNGNVTLQALPAGSTSWAVVGHGRTSTTGSYRFVATPARNTTYRVLYAGGAAVSSVSPSRQVKVVPALTVYANRTAVAVGNWVILRGTLAPKSAAPTATIRIKSGSGWRTLATVHVNTNGTFGFAWQAAVRGTATFQASVAANGFSPVTQVVTVHVR